MKSKLKITLLVLTLFAAFTTLSAQNAPRWVNKGTASINNQRSNDSYTLESFNTWGPDLTALETSGPDVLKKYVTERYNAQAQSIKLVEVESGENPVYYVNYKDSSGKDCTVVAKRIQTYDKFDDYELNVYQFEYYQLYAIGKPNVMPEFDDFTITKSYQGVSTMMSLVPGMAQLYKCQDTKAGVIIGGEVGFVGATLYFDYKRRDSHKMRSEEPEFQNSWRSKELAWRNFEIASISCAVALYIYNIVDGIKSKGAPQVNVKKAKTTQWTIAPYATVDEMGIGFSLRF